MQKTDPITVSILLLAAGSSSRLGRPKQLLPYRNTTLLRHLAAQAIASAASEVIIVLGSDSENMRRELKGLPLKIVENKDWEKGIGSSIRAGVREAGTAGAVLIMLCDQPLVTTSLLNSMIAAFSGNNSLIACSYSSTVGVPALFGKEFFSELTQLKGDAGAKGVLLRHREKIHQISFPAGSIDVDTEEDVKML